MVLGHKLLLGAAAVAIATAASFPSEIGALYRGSYPSSWQQREALSMCERSNSTFIRFLASDREECYSRLRNVVGERTGLWSRHDRRARQVAQAN